MRLDDLLQTLGKAYSGARAKADTARLYRYSRHITNPKYEESVAWCCERMRTLGFDDVEQLRFPTDGKKMYGNCKSPPFWNVERAWLKLKIGGRWHTVANHARVPTSVFPYSAPTDGVVHTRVVEAGATAVAGKLVFCDKLKEPPFALARRGVLGVATDFSPNWPGVRGPKGFQDGHRWENAYLLEDEAGLAGFSLSRRQGRMVRQALKRQGSIECKYVVQGARGAGHLHCATGCLRGAEKPDEEVVVVAHLYEPGANDNCSGVAGAIEALRAIREQVAQGELAPPKRTIRVVFTFEIVGFLAYFEHRRARSRTYVGGVNPDMIGQDQEKCRSVLHVYHTPDAVSSFVDPLLMHCVREMAGAALAYRPRRFIVNDNIVSDPAIGVPCPALIHLRDRFYHSNEDTPDKVSARTLQRVGGAMAVYLYAVAAMDEDLAWDTARLVVTAALRRLEEEAGGDRDRLEHALACELHRLETLEQVAGAPLTKARARVCAAAQRLRPGTKKRAVRVSSRLEKRARSLVPVRTVFAPLAIDHIPPEQRAHAPFNPTWSTKLNLAAFWSDGRRTVWDIHQRQRHEAKVPLGLEELVEFFLFLEQHKLIKLRRVKAR